MKKFKLFALTALFCAMGTNAFAQGTDLADGYLRYNHDGTYATITGFVAKSKVAAVTIPATVTDPDPALNGKTYKVTKIGKEAFKGETIITSVTIADTNVETIESGAFENCTNLASVTIGKNVKNINNGATPAVYNPVTAGTTLAVGTDYYPSATGGTVVPGDGVTVAGDGEYWTLGSAAVPATGAFKGCTKLATVNFVARANTDPELKMEAGTFAKTAITKLNLTGSNLKELNQLFEEMNNKLTEVVLPATLTTIGENAFKNLATLAKIDWSGVAVANKVTINANAFFGAPLITSLVLPGTKTMTLADNSLAGSNIAELTITSGKGGAGIEVNATGAGAKLTTLTIAPNADGKILGKLKAGAFTGATKLATININGDMEAADQIDAGSFVGAGSATTDDPTDFNLTVNYTPKANGTAEGVSSINVAAFNASAVTAATAIDVKLVTSTKYGKYIQDNYTATAHKDYIYRVALSFSAATFNLKVATGGSSKFYYAKLWTDEAKGYKIAKKQGDATVIVYQGYVDQSDAAIYMENLRIIDGYYWVPTETPVIVKSTSANDVILTESDGSHKSTLQTTETTPAGNEIKVVAADRTGLYVKDNTPTGFTSYALAPIDQAGYLWAGFKDERVLVGTTNGKYDKTTGTCTVDYVVECKNSSAARLNVIWLDGSEDNTTAIQTVKQNVEDGAIYNLAGQKVDANFKGVVIKNGKKMIQK